MKHRKIGNVMTDDVVTVGPATPFKEVARRLHEHRISGLPVVDDDENVLGVISETDLMLRQATQRPVYEPPRRRLLPRLTRRARAEHRKAQATSAEALMSRPAITVRADDTVTHAARIMAEHRVERLPVVDDESRLIGIVTRRDLLQVFVRSDADIRREVLDEVLTRGLWLVAGQVRVGAEEGIVVLEGELERQSEVEIAGTLTEKVDGVVGVDNRLTYRMDDSRIRPVEQARHGLADEWLRRV
ncbi:CBS domain-containing protein [Streptomyces sp. WMMC500]|uniref:CBS domain-containing protein n=1 Tax=Streptomyces sp. WMMC500 TaxID=3015154 RepID=UPI00248BD28F|nr:CBS domain-containing protein [Streptomyces sp. WMMC500]WBB61953.1 CBS domain-containing protein [Streptomyces sp. WMMC500]